MCLTVAETPYSLGACAVEKVQKELSVLDGFATITPYLGFRVPATGWLAARCRLNVDLAAGVGLLGCCVHSRLSESKSIWHDSFPAYAVGVMAWGKDDDVGSVLLYIPSCDKTGRRLATTQALNQIFRMPLTVARWNAVKRLVNASLPAHHLKKLAVLEDCDW